MDFNKEEKILITCGLGLAPYVSRELEQLGYEPGITHDAGVEITGSLFDCMVLNLHLSTAYNVLYLMGHFGCESPESLYKQIYLMAWEDIISPDEMLSVVCRVNTPTIDNTMFASLKVKDAIVDRIMDHKKMRPDSGKDKSGVVVHLYWKQDQAWLYINTSGKKISDRGYRTMPHKAPLRESLARAILMAMEYTGDQPFVGPMCGSGTLAIEAALMAQKRAPGLLRTNFGFMHLLGFNDDDWQTIRRQGQKQSKKRGGKAAFAAAPIIATDNDPAALEAAEHNAKTAGVDHLIEFKLCDFSETDIPEGAGVVVMNPEYGERIGKRTALSELYARIGDFLKTECKGYNGYVFTGNMDLAKQVRLKPSRRFEFFNADIDCRLLKYEIYPGTKRKD